jgi:hypothetical protein
MLLQAWISSTTRSTIQEVGNPGDGVLGDLGVIDLGDMRCGVAGGQTAGIQQHDLTMLDNHRCHLATITAGSSRPGPAARRISRILDDGELTLTSVSLIATLPRQATAQRVGPLTQFVGHCPRPRRPGRIGSPDMGLPGRGAVLRPLPVRTRDSLLSATHTSSGRGRVRHIGRH